MINDADDKRWLMMVIDDDDRGIYCEDLLTVNYFEQIRGRSASFLVPCDLQQKQVLQLNCCKLVQQIDVFMSGCMYNPRRVRGKKRTIGAVHDRCPQLLLSSVL